MIILHCRWYCTFFYGYKSAIKHSHAFDLFESDNVTFVKAMTSAL